MKRPYRARYTLNELIAITDEWEAWQEYKSYLNILIRLMDTENALMSLSQKQRQAVFLIGICQMSVQEAADLCGITTSPMWRRYQRGLDAMAHYLNGG